MQKRLQKAARLALGIATLGGIGLVGAFGAGTAGAAPTFGPGGSPVIGHVYLDDNTTGTNTISGFDRHLDGSLTPLAGSPFVAGGAGTGAAGGLASQGAIAVTNDGQFLIAVDAGSNQLSVLRINFNGSLQLVPNGVVSSDGYTPVSVAVHDGLVYAANAATGANVPNPTTVEPNYTGFTLSPFGQLQPLANSTVSLPNGSQPGDVLFNSTGTNLVGTRVGTSLIDSFSVGRNGLLTEAAGAPFSAQGLGPFGSEFRPTNPQQLFVSNAHNVGTTTDPLPGTVSAFNVAFNGSLTSIGASPVADDQAGTCWVAITPDGRYLFAVNTGTGYISTYQIAPNGSLTFITSTEVSNTAGVGATDASVSPDGRTLYVNESRVGTVGAFAISNGGTLTELPSSPVAVPGGAHPAGIVTTGL
ncbi:MAG: beta-propeller fold lactonase family protein, partial [Acidimicrobiales bacterium]